MRSPIHAIGTIILHRDLFTTETSSSTNAIPTAASRLPVAPQRQGVVLLPDLSAARLGLVVAVALVDAARPLARRREAASLAVLSVSVLPRRAWLMRTLCTGLTIQLMRGSVRMALCCGSTRMTSKYLYVESWLTQYELSTRRFGHRRPTRSSAVARRARWYLSWLTPWFVGLPAPQSAPPIRFNAKGQVP
jgi:hypothetical protein